jgi:hypothetical protein
MSDERSAISFFPVGEVFDLVGRIAVSALADCRYRSLWLSTRADTAIGPCKPFPHRDGKKLIADRSSLIAHRSSQCYPFDSDGRPRPRRTRLRS